MWRSRQKKHLSFLHSFSLDSVNYKTKNIELELKIRNIV